MPDRAMSLDRPSAELRKGGSVVGLTDRVYEIAGPEVVFDEVLVRGDLSGELTYNGHVLEVVHIDTAIGLEMSDKGPRGPIWKKVRCRVHK